MTQYINKDVLVAEIKEYIDYYNKGYTNGDNYKVDMLKTLLHDIDFFEVKEVDNIWHTENEFSNVEPNRSILLIEDDGRTNLLKSPSAERLFWYRTTNLKMWAYVDELLNIPNVQVKEVDLEKEIQQHINDCLDIKFPTSDIKMIAKDVEYTARKFFDLGLKSKGE